jgi:hypothetical protein
VKIPPSFIKVLVLKASPAGQGAGLHEHGKNHHADALADHLLDVPAERLDEHDRHGVAVDVVAEHVLWCSMFGPSSVVRSMNVPNIKDMELFKKEAGSPVVLENIKLMLPTVVLTISPLVLLGTLRVCSTAAVWSMFAIQVVSVWATRAAAYFPPTRATRIESGDKMLTVSKLVAIIWQATRTCRRRPSWCRC